MGSVRLLGKNANLTYERCFALHQYYHIACPDFDCDIDSGSNGSAVTDQDIP